MTSCKKTPRAARKDPAEAVLDSEKKYREITEDLHEALCRMARPAGTNEYFSPSAENQKQTIRPDRSLRRGSFALQPSLA
jgi:hypothetical protein